MLVTLTDLPRACRALPGSIPIDPLTRAFARVAGRSPHLTGDVTVPLDDTDALRRLLEDNPIAAWTEGKGTGGRAYFAYEDGVFRTTFDAPEGARDALQELVRELVDWGLGGDSALRWKRYTRDEMPRLFGIDSKMPTMSGFVQTSTSGCPSRRESRPPSWWTRPSSRGRGEPLEGVGARARGPRAARVGAQGGVSWTASSVTRPPRSPAPPP